MIAAGLRARISAAEARCETSSEYTRASRTRRAISCEYCPPRSSTSTGRSSGSACNWTTSAAAVIRRVLRDRDVVRMRLAQPRTRDAHEARLLQRVDRRRAAVAHRLAQAADDLVNDALERSLVGHPALDPLGHELVDVLDVALDSLHARDHLDDAAGMTVRRVDDEHVRARLDECLRALERVRSDADRGADAKPSVGVLGRERKLDPLLDVLHRDQALEHAVAVDHRQLL